MAIEDAQTLSVRSIPDIDSNNSLISETDVSNKVETEPREFGSQIRLQARIIGPILSSLEDFAYAFNREYRFVYANQALLDLWGLKLYDAVGKNFAELNYPKELAARLEQQIQLVFDTKQRVKDEVYYQSPTETSGYYEHIFSPVFAPDGSVEFIAGTSRDITARRQTEEKLRDSEALLQGTINALTGHIAVLDKNGVIVKVNETWRKFAEENLFQGTNYGIGQNYIEACIPNKPNECDPHGLEAADGIRKVANCEFDTFELEYPCHSPTEPNWFVMRVTRFNETKDDLRVVVAHENITKRKLAEEALRESNAFNQDILDSLTAHIAVLDKSGIITTVNEAWRQFAISNGADPTIQGVGIGTNYLHVCRAASSENSGESDSIYQNIKDVLSGADDFYAVEYPCHSPTVKRWFLLMVSPLKHSPCGGAVVSHMNITERKLIELALLESEENLRYTVELNPQIPWTANPLGEIESFSERWLDLTDLNGDEALGEGWARAPHPEDLPQMQAAWTRSIKTGEPYDIEHRVRLHDNSFRWMRSRAFPRRNEDGAIVRWYGTTEDINERKEAVEALKKSDRQKDEFLATLAHELRNPLAPIRSGLEIIRGNKGETTKTAQVLDIVERQTNQIIHLVDDLLDISRISQGKINLRLERIELRPAIELAVETIRDAIESNNHQFTLQLPAEPVYLEADLTRVTQIFLNLLNNAAKYTPPGGKIWLTAEKKGDEIVISVKDTGIGIAPQMLTGVFEMFSQITNSSEQARGGLGIGLSVVQKLVQMHGGTIRSFSAGEGMGSEFVVHLPLAVDQSQPAKEFSAVDIAQTSDLKAPSNGHQTSEKKRVLVVDDNADAAEMLHLLLAQEGHQVRIDFDGETALETAKTFQPDACILDIGLPQMDGYELAERLRGLFPQIKLIALSGWGQAEDRRRSQEAGFNFHLVKPVNLEDVKILLNE